MKTPQPRPHADLLEQQPQDVLRPSHSEKRTVVIDFMVLAGVIITIIYVICYGIYTVIQTVSNV
jgi:hypothetical protein